MTITLHNGALDPIATFDYYTTILVARVTPDLSLGEYSDIIGLFSFALVVT